jgi:GTP pyrophosphokinase
VPNDEIIGYISQGRGFISIHRANCHNLFNLVKDPERILRASWEDGGRECYEVGISALAHDRSNLLADMLLAIASTSTVINAAQARAIDKGLAKCSFEVVVENKKGLERIIREIEKVEGVIEVHRSLPK